MCVGLQCRTADFAELNVYGSRADIPPGRLLYSSGTSHFLMPSGVTETYQLWKAAKSQVTYPPGKKIKIKKDRKHFSFTIEDKSRRELHGNCLELKMLGQRIRSYSAKSMTENIAELSRASQCLSNLHSPCVGGTHQTIRFMFWPLWSPMGERIQCSKQSPAQDFENMAG